MAALGQFLGVDGCRGSWVVASSSSPDISTIPALSIASFAEVVAAVEAGAFACVDIPIGLLNGSRACDGEARGLLRWPRAASVFTPPCRAALAASDRAERRRINLAYAGMSLSEQTLRIADRIGEVDRLVTPALQTRLRECHPEVVFALLSREGKGLRHGKKSRAGKAQRLRLLPPAFRAAARARVYPRPDGVGVSPDDIIDALACLLAAFRVSCGNEVSFPKGAIERDERGLRAEIVA